MNTIASACQPFAALQVQLPNVKTVSIYQYYANDRIGGFRFFYSPESGIQNGWTREKVAFYGFEKQTPGVIPVYQYHKVYTDGSVKYYYSTKGNEGNNWKPDVPLPAFYVYSEAHPFTQPVYQYYADDLKDGGKKYFYSTDSNAAKNGWTLDFVAFHVAIAEKLELTVAITNFITTEPNSNSSTIAASKSLSIDIADKLELFFGISAVASLKSAANKLGILDTDDAFTVAIEFTGGGNVFEALTKQGLTFEIEYFAETYGRGSDVTLGTVAGTLVAGQLTYDDSVTILEIPRIGNKLTPGYYRIAAQLTIRDRHNQILVSTYSDGTPQVSFIQVIE